MHHKKISSALISVFHKDGLAPIVDFLAKNNVKMFSTGGTYDFIDQRNLPVTQVENLTQYPSIFGGRVKTLHPKIFGGILNRRDHKGDQSEKTEFDVPDIDLLIVDLYPFEDTVANPDSNESDIIEKIDIGGISLIRAAAKNHKDVTIVSSRDQYEGLLEILMEKSCGTELTDRKLLAAKAFDISSHYDTAIFNYLNQESQIPTFKASHKGSKSLRYGENPHQAGSFYGNIEELFTQIHGKELSYNNLVDVDAAVHLIGDFDESAFGILKHNNACGFALSNSPKEAYEKALQADPVSAFGGVLISNDEIDESCAKVLHELFFEIIIARGYSKNALDILSKKKNRIILIQKSELTGTKQFKTLLNGVVEQELDQKVDEKNDLKVVTKVQPSNDQISDLLFASKLAKHTKSNTIVLAKDGQMLSSGVGQTSRVDALEQAIEKAKKFKFDLDGAVMASDAFFPFPDCVEIGHKAGIRAIIQPGGSIKDQLSIDYCDENDLSMVLTGFRHFKH